MANSNRVCMTARLEAVSRPTKQGKYRFEVIDRETAANWKFWLAEEKALKLANKNRKFPKGAMLRLTGSRSAKNPGYLLHVKVQAIDGHDVQAWAESNSSPTVSHAVQESAQERVKKARRDAEEAAMRDRAPPEQPPKFTTPEAAWEKGLYIVTRQSRLKERKLTMMEIWTLRDALNFLKEYADGTRSV